MALVEPSYSHDEYAYLDVESQNVRDEYGFLDPTKLVLQVIAPLCAQGMPHEKALYFEAKVHPFLTSVIDLVMAELPEALEVTVLLWLLGVAGVPVWLSSQIQDWASSNSNAQDAPEVPTGGGYESEGDLDPTGEEPLQARLTLDAEAGHTASALAAAGSTTHLLQRPAAYPCELQSPSGTVLHESRETPRHSILANDLERLALLQQTQLLRHLDEATLMEFCRMSKLVTFADGAEVAQVGRAGEAAHVVVSGEAKTSVLREIGSYTTGDLFGHVELIDGVSSSLTVEASGPLTTLCLPAARFRELGLPEKLAALHKRSNKAVKHRGTRRGVVAQAGAAELVPSFSMDEPSSVASEHMHDADRAMVLAAFHRNPNLEELFDLSSEDAEVALQGVKRVTFVEGEVVFSKGDFGDTFYVVQDGVFKITDMDDESRNAAKKPSIVLYSLRAGDSFGELALLYESERTETVTCARDGSLWAMSRQKFREVAHYGAERRILEYLALVSRSDKLSWLSEDDQRTVCEAFEERYYVKRERIVVQGQPGNSFYVIFKGTCAVYVDGEWVTALSEGDCFGERALTTHETRTATVEVTSQTCTALALERETFNLVIADHVQVDEDGIDMDEEIDEVCELSPSANISPNSKGGGLTHCISLRVKQVMSRQNTLPARASRVVPLDRLERVGMLGRGSFGSVSLERDVRTGSYYALKAMSKAHIVAEKIATSVVNEKIVSELLDSDFVVRLLNVGRDAQNIYLLLEACFGGDLFDVYNNERVFGSELHARFYAGSVSLALDHLHSRRIIYRDLKLENCLLTGGGYLKLADMGLAKVVVGRTYTVCGTTDYFAPETLRQHGHNRAVDWWALGVMIFIMMSGRSPFEAPDAMGTYKRIMKGIAKVSFPSSIGEECVSIVRGLCQKVPEERLTMGVQGVQIFKEHRWYVDFDWDALQGLTMPAPFNPEVDEMAVIRRAQGLEVEPLCDVPYEDDGSGWDDAFDEGNFIAEVTSHVSP
jgi:CRP-like cAMP-binding protein